MRKNNKILFIILGIIVLAVLVYFVFTKIKLPQLAQQPISTTTSPSIQPQPGSCLVLEEKFCHQGKLVKIKYQGKDIVYVGFKLPEGTVIFAPFDGYFSKERWLVNPNVKSYAVTIDSNKNLEYDERDIGFGLFGNIMTLKGEEFEAKKGEIIGKVINGPKILDNQDYNILFSFLKFDPKAKLFVDSRELIKQYFKIEE